MRSPGMLPHYSVPENPEAPQVYKYLPTLYDHFRLTPVNPTLFQSLFCTVLESPHKDQDKMKLLALLAAAISAASLVAAQ